MEVIIIVICAGSAVWVTGSRLYGSGKAKQDWLRRIPEPTNGIPSQGTFVCVFRLLIPELFAGSFVGWMAAQSIPNAQGSTNHSGVTNPDGQQLTVTADMEAQDHAPDRVESSDQEALIPLPILIVRKNSRQDSTK